MDEPRKALTDQLLGALLQAPDGREQLLHVPDRPWLAGESYIQRGGLGPERLGAADSCKTLADFRRVLRDTSVGKSSGSLIGQRGDHVVVGSVSLRQRTRA